MQPEYKKQLNSVRSFTCGLRKRTSDELECRFGSYSSHIFTSGVQRSDFEFIKASLEQKCAARVSNTVTRTCKERRSVQDVDTGACTFGTKKKLRWFDCQELGIRVQLSQETSTSNNINISNNMSNNMSDIEDPDNPVFVRHRQRWSFNLPGTILVELTIAKQDNNTNNNNNTVYEIEIECRSLKFIDNFIGSIEQILQLLQRSQYVLTATHQKNVLNCYAQRFSMNSIHFPGLRFPGSQPETLCHDNIETIYSKPYAVAWKTDGLRVHVFYHTHDIYIIPNSLDPSRITMIGFYELTDFTGTVLDAEYVHSNTKLYKSCDSLQVFDCLFYGMQDLRVPDKILIDRLNCARLAVSTPLTIPKYISFVVKEFSICGNTFQALQQTMKTAHSSITDGFIFVPELEPHPRTSKWPHLFKWKPAELNTVDVVFKQSHPNVFEALVGGLNNSLVNLTTPDELPGTLEWGLDTDIQLNMSVNLNNAARPQGYERMGYSEFREKLLQHIWECGYDPITKQLVLVKPRHDKTKPNFHTIATKNTSLWYNPLPIEKVLSPENPTAKFNILHNVMKFNLFEKHKPHSLLDISFSQPWDVTQWYAAGITLVDAFLTGNNRKEVLAEAEVIKARIPPGFDFAFINEDPVSGHKSYEMVTCHSGLDGFLNDGLSLMNLVHNSLFPKGIFCVTATSTSSHKKIMDLCKQFGFKESSTERLVVPGLTESFTIAFEKDPWSRVVSDEQDWASLMSTT